MRTNNANLIEKAFVLRDFLPVIFQQFFLFFLRTSTRNYSNYLNFVQMQKKVIKFT